MRSFQDSIEKLLWPERRPRDPVLGQAVPGGGLIDRTTTASFLRITAELVPPYLRQRSGNVLNALGRRLSLVRDEGLVLGPIPAGAPVNVFCQSLARCRCRR